MVDPSIPLSVKTPNIDPFTTGAKLSQLGAMQQEGQLRGMELQDKIKAQADQAAVDTALQGGDPEKAVTDLYGAGHGRAAMNLQQTLLTQKTKRMEMEKGQVEIAAKKNEMLSPILNSITDDASFQLGKQAVTGLLGPQAAASLGDTYNPATIKAARDSTMKMTDLIREHHNGVTEAQTALGELNRTAANAPLVDKHWQDVLGPQFANAKDQDSLDRLLSMWGQAGAPKSVLDGYRGKSPEEIAAMQKTPHEKTTETETAARDLETRRNNSYNNRLAAGRLDEERLRDSIASGAGLFGPATGLQLPPVKGGASAGAPTAGGSAAPPTAAPKTPAEALGITPDMHGDDLLDKLPPTTAATVKAFAMGKRLVPSGFAQKTPYWQNMMSLVQQYDPSFDEHRYGYIKDFNNVNGTTGKQVGALNTAMQHLDLLDQMVDSMGNKDSRTFNEVANRFKTEFGWTGKTDFDTVAPQLAKEIERVWRGSGGTAGEINDLLDKSMSSSATQGQQKSALTNAVKLVEGKLKSLEYQRDSTLGVAKDAVKIVSPATQKILDRFTPNLDGLEAGHARTFNDGSFKGQTWTVDDNGRPKRVK